VRDIPDDIPQSTRALASPLVRWPLIFPSGSGHVSELVDWRWTMATAANDMPKSKRVR